MQKYVYVSWDGAYDASHELSRPNTMQRGSIVALPAGIFLSSGSRRRRTLAAEQPPAAPFVAATRYTKPEALDTLPEGRHDGSQDTHRAAPNTDSSSSSNRNYSNSGGSRSDPPRNPPSNVVLHFGQRAPNISKPPSAHGGEPLEPASARVGGPPTSTVATRRDDSSPGDGGAIRDGTAARRNSVHRNLRSTHGEEDTAETSLPPVSASALSNATAGVVSFVPPRPPHPQGLEQGANSKSEEGPKIRASSGDRTISNSDRPPSSGLKGSVEPQRRGSSPPQSSSSAVGASQPAARGRSPQPTPLLVAHYNSKNSKSGTTASSSRTTSPPHHELGEFLSSTTTTTAASDHHHQPLAERVRDGKIPPEASSSSSHVPDNREHQKPRREEEEEEGEGDLLLRQRRQDNESDGSNNSPNDDLARTLSGDEVVHAPQGQVPIDLVVQRQSSKSTRAAPRGQLKNGTEGSREKTHSLRGGGGGEGDAGHREEVEDFESHEQQHHHRHYHHQHHHSRGRELHDAMDLHPQRRQATSPHASSSPPRRPERTENGQRLLNAEQQQQLHFDGNATRPKANSNDNIPRPRRDIQASSPYHHHHQDVSVQDHEEEHTAMPMPSTWESNGRISPSQQQHHTSSSPQPLRSHAASARSISPSQRTFSGPRHLQETDTSMRHKATYVETEDTSRRSWYCSNPAHHRHDGILSPKEVARAVLEVTELRGDVDEAVLQDEQTAVAQLPGPETFRFHPIVAPGSVKRDQVVVQKRLHMLQQQQERDEANQRLLVQQSEAEASGTTHQQQPPPARWAVLHEMAKILQEQKDVAALDAEMQRRLAEDNVIAEGILRRQNAARKRRLREAALRDAGAASGFSRHDDTHRLSSSPERSPEMELQHSPSPAPHPFMKLDAPNSIQTEITRVEAPVLTNSGTDDVVATFTSDLAKEEPARRSTSSSSDDVKFLGVEVVS